MYAATTISEAHLDESALEPSQLVVELESGALEMTTVRLHGELDMETAPRQRPPSLTSTPTATQPSHWISVASRSWTSQVCGCS